MGTAAGLMLVGLVLLAVGGEILVRGASRLAALAGISPLVIGLTVVAFGTSAPELAVSLKASYDGETDIAVGNVVGSNILNVLFILGLSALIAPLRVSSQLIRADIPLMIAASIAMLLLGLDGAISRLDGIGLFSGLLIYTGLTLLKSRKLNVLAKEQFKEEIERRLMKASALRVVWQFILIGAGLALLTGGARWLVDGATTLARLAGMSELLIGLTIVALGTSLPEAATSVLASLRGERDIAVGNVVGSNIFNILCVLGLSASVVPHGVQVSTTALRLDIPIMIGVAVACLPIFFTGHLIARWEGGLFLAYYVAYTIYLILDETAPAVSHTFGFVMLSAVVPLTAVALVWGVAKSQRNNT